MAFSDFEKIKIVIEIEYLLSKIKFLFFFFKNLNFDIILPVSIPILQNYFSGDNYGSILQVHFSNTSYITYYIYRNINNSPQFATLLYLKSYILQQQDQ